ncbi:metal-sensitive transcriptional regulator [Pseudoclavibacter caeni]|jgi:CsoR family transcriptional regulator, copper-sensing transcriptional repressor|uniref:Metal-sensitive transcriptional regulator n=1 Tax=Pseudoclavibacter caeni TaxID=908846 RepID=A0A7C8BNB7_9MICO|nr:metal-sensitive transcriptional regulator [Pseudoclavibacter caeni]KAB1632359.1 metal-sensitive transcriptional regulator [Pseudoclavibacter caeni]NYJ97600.1 DNA-binding FrmR family transcriptional regulator [Pseudoclavibacter caeni]
MIEDIKRRALHRVRILEGQLRAIERQIEQEDYCVDIVTQSLAVQRSLASLNSLLVENHLRTHVPHMLQAGGEEREQAIEELVRLYGLKGRGD